MKQGARPSIPRYRWTGTIVRGSAVALTAAVCLCLPAASHTSAERLLLTAESPATFLAAMLPMQSRPGAATSASVKAREIAKSTTSGTTRSGSPGSPAQSPAGTAAAPAGGQPALPAGRAVLSEAQNATTGRGTVAKPRTVADRSSRATVRNRANAAFLQAFSAAEMPQPGYAEGTAAGLNSISLGAGSASGRSNAYLPTPDGSVYHAGASVPQHVAGLAVRTESSLSHLEPSSFAETHAKYDAVNLRTNVSIPAFRHTVHVSVGGGYEHLVQPLDGEPLGANTEPSESSLGASANAVTGTTNAAVLNGANRLDLNRTGYSATATVPVNSHVRVGVGYSEHDLRGGAGLTAAAPVDQRQQTYTGSVTYAPRDGRSSITLEGGAARAIDNVNATVDSNVKGGDVLFSVKF